MDYISLAQGLCFIYFADEPIDRVDAEDLGDVSLEETECVLEIEPLVEEVEFTSTRRVRASMRESSQPQWVKCSAADHTKLPSFEQSYELDGTLK